MCDRNAATRSPVGGTGVSVEVQFVGCVWVDSYYTTRTTPRPHRIRTGGLGGLQWLAKEGRRDLLGDVAMLAAQLGSPTLGSLKTMNKVIQLAQEMLY